MDYYCVIFIFCILFVSETDGINSLSYCGEIKTWIEAKTFCEAKGGRIMNRGTENDASFLQRTDIPSYQEIWLGQYKGLSEWIEQIGCFDERSLGVSWYSIETQNNSAASCQSLCNSTDYFALQGTTCLCSYNTYVNTSYFTPKSNCVNVCPGNTAEKCGGTQSLTVYHRVSSDRIQYSSNLYPQFKCTMMNCTSSTEWTYEEQNCDESYPVLCGSGVLVNQPAPWKTAQTFCTNYGSLIGLHNMVDSCSISVANVKRQFWIGVYKNEVDLPLKDKVVQNPVIGCYTIYKQPSYSQPIIKFYSIEICEKQNKFPFICELPPGNPENNGCYLPPTTTGPSTTGEPQPLVEADDNGLKIGLYVALGVVVLAAIIVVIILLTKRKKNDQEEPRRLDILASITSLKLGRRKGSGGGKQKKEISKPIPVKIEDEKSQYAVVNKPDRRQSAPEPRCKVYSRPDRVVNDDKTTQLNSGYDKLRVDPKVTPNSSILKSPDKHVPEQPITRHVSIHDEGYTRRGDAYSEPRRPIPVPPPVLKYSLEHKRNNNEHIGTTLL